MKQKYSETSGLDCIESVGPWPFITRRIYKDLKGEKFIWYSRNHRKRLGPSPFSKEVGIIKKTLICLWNPSQLNWWIAIIFAIGSLCFATASFLSLNPDLLKLLYLSNKEVNSIFFLGSIPFTIASYLQLYQSANTEPLPNDDRLSSKTLIFFGWRPNDIGWLSCMLQFIGTLMFNLSTFEAMDTSMTWVKQDILSWTPDLVGSILFLLSGYLAFIETCHAHFAFHPKDISWWITLSNLFGCLGFIISSGFGVVLPESHIFILDLSYLFTLIGASGFFLGSALMLPEAAS